MSFVPQNIPIQAIPRFWPGSNISLDVLRLDLVHPVISGNKWFKLKGFVARAKDLHKTHILTFGGAYSNHILATAALCQETGISSIGIIRGEKPSTLSPTLEQALGYGMKLYFISRAAYREKQIPGDCLKEFSVGKALIVSEGGYGTDGVKGIDELFRSLDVKGYTHILVAIGTGTTLCGIVTAAGNSTEVVGISPFKKDHSQHAAIHQLLPPLLHNRYRLITDDHFGGYAKYTPELITFMNEWYKQTGIPSDLIYTAKLFYKLHTMLTKKVFSDNSHILAVHTGGLQGNRSLEKGTLIFDHF